MCSGLELLSHMETVFTFFEALPYCFPQWLHWFPLRQQCKRICLFSTPSPASVIHQLSNDGLSDQCEVVPPSSVDLQRKWQPTPVFLPWKFHGQRSLVVYSPWGHKEWDTTNQLNFTSLISNAEHLFICLFTICVSSFKPQISAVRVTSIDFF